ncbi:MAG TPA: hypothetical protein ENJ20_01295, partial [Bacteroidetes bacterium]|nr:hypothetical protein [Bacteroidota bacterium]
RYRETQTNLNLLTGLAPGNYFVEIYFESDVTFNNGNANVDDVLVHNNGGNYFRASFSTQPSSGGTIGLVVTGEQPVSCNGGTDGSATVVATNGTAPVNYLWSNGATGASALHLAAGTYGVTATDANGNTGSLTLTIGQPASLQANPNSTGTSSAASLDGTATAQPSGGTPPYTFLWNTGATSASITGLAPGSYSVTVTDQKGCVASGTVLVNAPSGNPVSYCHSEGDFPWVDWISRFTLNGIDHTSGKSKYSNFTNFSTDLHIGQDQAFSIENSYSWQTYDEYFKIWIDYNGNGTFDEPGEIAFQGILTAPPLGTATALTTGTINLPATATEGLTRLRLALKRGAYPSPCETIPFGEVEDYTVNLINGGVVACSINSNVSNLICNDNATPFDPADDTYSFRLLVNGSGSSTNWTTTINGQNYPGTYGTPLTINGLTISSGPLSFTISDQADGSCSIVQNVSPPATCSDGTPCSITTNMSIPICHDNGTPDDPSDDTYTLNLTVSGTGTAPGWSANVSGQLQSGLYGITTPMGPYPINQGSQQVTITDDNDAGCTADLTFNPPGTCSNGGSGLNYCASVSSFPWHDWIEAVTFGTIDNTSNKTPYSDFTSLSANVTAGNSYPIALTSGFSWFTQDEHWMVWIDYNRNGQFEEPGEIALSLLSPAPPNGTNSHTVNGTIIIPATAAAGPARMRIAMKRDAPATPCETLPFGEVEDYTVLITSNANSPSNQLSLNLTGVHEVESIELYAMVRTGAQNAYWVLEKSADNVHFETIRTGPANSGQTIALHDSDHHPTDGQNFYRLSVLDENDILLGNSHTVIPFEHVGLFGLFPNPANNSFSIQLSDWVGKSVRIGVYNQ